MLSEQMKAEGWIEHDGGECPVPLDSRPSVMFRNKVTVEGGREDAGVLSWVHGVFAEKFRHLEIIAYRPETGHD